MNYSEASHLRGVVIIRMRATTCTQVDSQVLGAGG